MCGIAGFTQPSENAPTVLQRMKRAIAHRGPDDEGQFLDAQIALGHRRLSILDLKNGHQPMSTRDQTLWIVFNGEIYNYVELNKDLQARGHSIETHCDTETILHLYDVYGEHCVDYLNGMFAFLIYDKRRQILFAARDRFGIKPFYYALIDSHFVFASEIKALLQYPSLKARLNSRALTEYIYLQTTLGSKTLFDGINKLPPAHGLSFDLKKQTVRTWEYWRPAYAPDHTLKETHVVDELKRLLNDSVRIQLRSDAALGAYLSGGLDSSLITSLAADHCGQRLKTFTGGFHEPGFDETSYAKIAAAGRPTIDYHELYIGPEQFAAEMSKLIYHMDEPSAGPGIFPQAMVARLAARHVKVVLGGQGGDEIFGGYARYAFMHVLEKPFTRAWQWWTQRKLFKAYAPSVKKLLNGKLWHRPLGERYFLLAQRIDQAQRYYVPDVLDAKTVRSIVEEFTALYEQPEQGTAFERAAYCDFKILLPALLHVEDRVSMAASLESRVPFLDHRLVDFLGRVPAQMKFKNGTLKYLLKNVARDSVPQPILARRDKMGFPVPLVQWAKGPLRSFLQDNLSSQASRSRGIFFNDAIVQSLGREHAFGRDIWGCLCLELWFQNFIDH